MTDLSIHGFKQRARRFGTSNPERIVNAHWEWMVRRGISSWSARNELGLSGGDGPQTDWTFDRMGMSRTRMSDGRLICIGGEHEDWYDPDFCIFNDVIVLQPGADGAPADPGSSAVELYGYPAEVFPPTDFQAAVLVGDLIYLIGGLGYSDARVEGRTPVFTLNTRTYEIRQVATEGVPPGWIYKHHAVFEPSTHSIVTRGGNIWVPERTSEIEHHAVHRLRLDGMRWELLREHERWVWLSLRAEGGGFDIEDGRYPTARSFQPKDVPIESFLAEERGTWVYTISVNGVRVTFKEFIGDVDVLIEGELSPELHKALLDDIIDNLSEETGVKWTIDDSLENALRLQHDANRWE